MVGRKIKCIKSCDALIGRINEGDIFIVVDKILSNVASYSGSGYTPTYTHERYILCNIETNKLFVLNVSIKISNFELINE